MAGKAAELKTLVLEHSRLITLKGTGNCLEQARMRWRNSVVALECGAMNSNTGTV